MQIEIKAGEYLFNESGTHICDAEGFATRAVADTTVEVTDTAQIAVIEAYQTEARYVAPIAGA
jgi:hypothetical protein